MNEKDFFQKKDADFRKTARPERGIRYIRPAKCQTVPERLVKFKNAEELAKNTPPEKGMRQWCLVDGSFIFGDFIEAWLVEHNLKAREMTLATLSMSQENVDSLRNLIEGDYVDSLRLLVSDYFYSHERGNLVKYIYEELDIDNRFQLAVAGSHCKLALIETENGSKIVIHGSANLRSSACLEHFVIEENPELFDFNLAWLDAIFEKFSTIQKAERHSKLWQTVQTSGSEPTQIAPNRPTRKKGAAKSVTRQAPAAR